MENRDAKMKYLIHKYGYQCPIARSKNQAAHVTDLHHARIHNSKWARKKYPLFIDSLWNLIAVNNCFHLGHGSYGKWPERLVEKRERFLEKHPAIAEFLNNPI